MLMWNVDVLLFAPIEFWIFTPEQDGSQLDELVAAGRQVCDGDSPLLLDVLCHRLQLLPADVDELASVVDHP